MDSWENISKHQQLRANRIAYANGHKDTAHIISEIESTLGITTEYAIELFNNYIKDNL